MSASRARAARAKIYFASNRRIHGLWQSTIPSRFLDELPEAHVEVTEAKGGFGGYRRATAPRASTTMTAFGSNYTTPGWQRAQARKARGGGFEDGSCRRLRCTRPTAATSRDDAPAASARQAPARPAARRQAPRLPLTIEGELVAKSTGTVSAFALGDRVFHQKFGNGNVTAHRRQQAHHPVRQGRREARGGQLRRADLIAIRGIFSTKHLLCIQGGAPARDKHCGCECSGKSAVCARLTPSLHLGLGICNG